MRATTLALLLLSGCVVGNPDFRSDAGGDGDLRHHQRPDAGPDLARATDMIEAADLEPRLDLTTAPDLEPACEAQIDPQTGDPCGCPGLPCCDVAARGCGLGAHCLNQAACWRTSAACTRCAPVPDCGLFGEAGCTEGIACEWPLHPAFADGGGTVCGNQP